jgi:phosphomannomutase
MKIRQEIAAVAQKQIPEFNVKVAGLTSIDVTVPGVDKAYGMKKLLESTGLTKEDVLFMGDKIVDGGNDLPVQTMGVDCIAVRSWEDTAYAIEGILGVS